MTESAHPHRIYLLGGLRAEAPGGAVAVPGGKPQALLAYLILYPHTPHTREQLMENFWPDVPAERAGRYLSNALYRLRASLGGEWLQVEEERLGVQRDSVWVDVWEFERLAKSARAADWEQALARYAGDLLPEIYADWILLPRLSLRERFLAVLGQAAEQCATDGRWPEAAGHLRRLVAADPLNENARRNLMHALARLGRVAEALRTFDELQAMLHSELEVAPAEETRALAEQLRSEMVAARAATRPARPAFVGRGEERARLIARLEQAQAGHGGFAVLLGEAGMGKTRLLEELQHAAGWRGWQVCWGRGEEFGVPAPFAPLSAALQAALPAIRLHQVARMVEPMWLGWLSGLVPDLAAHLPGRAASPPPDAQQLTRALARVLAALSRIHPHLFLLDDVHWAEAEMWPVLADLGDKVGQIPVLVVLGGRPDEWQRQPEAWRSVGDWDRAGAPVITLGGLPLDELSQLLAPGAEPLGPERLRQLHTATAGNPLLALELAQAGDLEAALRHKPGLADLALRRLDSLSGNARLALQAASLLGYRVRYPLWEALLDRLAAPVSGLPEWAGELERAHLLQLAGGEYVFAHDTLRAAVYGALAPAQVKEWHAHALAILESQPGGDATDRLYHARRAEDAPAIARHARAAGERALAGFAYRTATGFFAEALAATPLGAPRERFELLRGQAEALRILGDRERLPEALHTLAALSAELGEAALQAEAALQRARYDWQTGDFEHAQAAAERGLALASGDKLRADLGLELGRIARDRGDYAAAQGWLDQALAHYEAARDEAGQATAQDLLGIVAQRQGRPHDAIALHTATQQTFHRLGDLRSESHSLSNLGVALWMQGDFTAARAAFERVLPISRDLGDVNSETAALTNLAALAGTAGDFERALELQSAALSLARAAGNRPRLANLLGNLGDTLHLLGRVSEARAAFEEALQLDRELGRRRGEGYVLHALGQLLLEASEPVEAQINFEAALHIRVELAERVNALITRASLAAAHLAQGRRPEAEAALQSALGELDDVHAGPEILRDVHFIAYRAFAEWGQRETALEHLRAAEAAMQALAEKLAPEDSRRFLERVPDNRRIVEAVAHNSEFTTVRLARAEAPLGRPLTEADFVSVRWTLSTVSDAAIPDATERRRHILRRLLAEAGAQGAAPTDDDLARALGVARRTIERDMAALQAAGHPLPTRRRKARA